MLFINDSDSCIKISCGHYTVSLSKQSSWYNCLIDNSTNSLNWEDCKDLTRVIYNTLNRGKKLLPDQEWVVEDYFELSKILEGLIKLNKSIKQNYQEVIQHGPCTRFYSSHR